MSLACAGAPPVMSPTEPPAWPPPPPPQALSTSAVAATSAPTPAPRRDGFIGVPLLGVAGSDHGVDPSPVARDLVVGDRDARLRRQRALARGLHLDAPALPALVEGGEQRAAGAEPAARRGVRRAGQVAGEQHPLPAALDDRVGHRDGRYQRLGVRVLRRREHL